LIEYTQLTELPADYVKRKVDEFLHEDMPDDDKTAGGIYRKGNLIKAVIQAEDDIVLSGINLTPLVFENNEVKILHNDREYVLNETIIATVTGQAADILKKERVYLNLIQRMSGIATMTAKYVEKTKPYDVKILDTRKTTPGLRLFEKYSVCMGGGHNHRMNLSSGILIKDNHIKAAGGVKAAINLIKEKHYSLPLEIEVENEEQIKEAMEAGVDGFLLDNMNREATFSGVKLIRSYPQGNDIFIESSGGINLSNLSNYVDTGINAISIGSLTHSIKAADIHIEFEKL